MANDIKQIIITRRKDCRGWYIITANGSDFFEDWTGVLDALRELGV